MRRSLSAPLRALVFAVAAGGLLAGCTQPDNTPQEYGEATEAVFFQGCTESYSPNGTIATPDFCRCAYDLFVNNVPASEKDRTELRSQQFAGYTGKNFRDIDHDMKSDPNKINDPTYLPTNVLDKIKACPGYGSRPEAQGGATATTGAVVGPTSPPASTAASSAGSTPGSSA